MPGDVLGSTIETMYYIRSDTAFNIARARGLWEVMRGRVTGRNPHLLSLRLSVAGGNVADARYLGLQMVLTKDIGGSMGRSREFSRSFLPVGSTARQKERWRQSYTQLLSGHPCPPVQLCRADATYYVVNGHHRVSAARYLNVETIQAHVSELDINQRSRSNGEPA